jgi:hypothetical protein
MSDEQYLQIIINILKNKKKKINKPILIKKNDAIIIPPTLFSNL